MNFQEKLKEIRELAGLDENVKSILKQMTGKELVSYEGIDALVAALMTFYNSEIKDIRKDIDSGTITVSWNSISGKPNSFPTAWSSVTDKPSSFPPSAHNQSWTTITDKPTIFPTNWGNVDGKPSTFPPDSHTHPYLSTSGGTVNGNLTVTGQIVSNGDVTAFSDRELKENIKPLKENFIDDLQVYSYNYIGKDSIRYGVIAQELQKIYPNLVIETEKEINERKALAVRDRDIIYLLLDAYQKLSKRVSELERGE